MAPEIPGVRVPFSRRLQSATCRHRKRNGP
jgi:hypothetical protein